GDSTWIEHLRGQEGIFAIGTADAHDNPNRLVAEHPRPHLQCLGELCLSWYALAHGEPNYRPLPVEFTLGPDLARPLHPVWTAIEAHAERLDRLYRQQAGLRCEVISGEKGPELAVLILLAEPDLELRVLVREKEVRYFLVQDGELLAADCPEWRVDRGVYLLLAELAARAQ